MKLESEKGYIRELRGLFRSYVGSWVYVVRARALSQDLLSAVTVAAVALPLNIGLAIASGMPPSAGLIAGAVGGGVAALLGSSQYQVSGPAAALTLMVLGLAKDFGTSGVAAATVYVGVVGLLLSLALAGRVVKFVPESVLAGFTTGVGLKLFDQQIPALLGFPELVDWASKGTTPSTIDIAMMMHHPRWLHDVSWLAAMSGIFVTFVVTAMRPFKRFPAAIVSIALVTFVSVYLRWDLQRVGDVPAQFPPPSIPWLADEKWIDLLTRATPLALLAAAESLFSARAVDRMANAKVTHDPNVELFGQGVANIAVGFFGGMPVTGVVARSGVNVQSGGKTRVAAFMHSIFLALAVLFLSRSISQVPLAALAGLLCVIGFRLIELRTLVHLYNEHKLEALAFVVAMIGTVSGHLITGLGVGLLLHFINRRIHRHERAAIEELESNRRKGIRAVLGTTIGELRVDHDQRESRASRVPRAPRLARVPGGVPTAHLPNAAAPDGSLQDIMAVYVGRGVSIDRTATVHGPSYIGDDTVVGPRAVVHDAIVGARCLIGMEAVVVGVEIPDNRRILPKKIVDTADAVDGLPLVSDTFLVGDDDRDGASLAPSTAALRENTAHQPESWEAEWTPPYSLPLHERF
jgi:sulfate permease, SulP family